VDDQLKILKKFVHHQVFLVSGRNVAGQGPTLFESLTLFRKIVCQPTPGRRFPVCLRSYGVPSSCNPYIGIVGGCLSVNLFCYRPVSKWGLFRYIVVLPIPHYYRLISGGFMVMLDYARRMCARLVEEVVGGVDRPAFMGSLLSDYDGERGLRRWVGAGDDGNKGEFGGDVWAWILLLNPLNEGEADQICQFINVVEPGTRLVVWSGTVGDGGLFEREPGNWLGAGFAELNGFAERIRGDLVSRGVRLLFLPHGRHVLSDGPACVKFMREQLGAKDGVTIDEFSLEGCPFGIALSPVLLMEPSMVADSEDHIRRIVEVVGPIAEAVVFEDGVVDVERDQIVVRGYDGDGDAAGGPVWMVDWDRVRNYLQEMGWSGVILDKR